MRSIGDDKLAKYGFRWEINPYRIVDIATSQIVQAGPHFDWTAHVLEEQRKAFDRKRANLFKKVS